ncbi:helix-turn-helix transcriptional regulator [Kitasatospora viridis]|nr:LuxR C-terminal-related transcriptional regulator [Kitasatospora viridis]
MYEYALNHPEWTEDEVRSVFAWGPREFAEAIERLAGLGLLIPSPGTPNGWYSQLPQAAMAAMARNSRQRLESALAAANDAHATLAGTIEAIASMRVEQTGDVSLAERGPELAALLEEVTNSAKSEILSMQPTPAPTATQAKEARERNTVVLRRGVSLRTVYQLSSASLPHMAHHLRLLTAAGMRVRTLPTLPVRMIIVDEALAVVSAGAPQDGRAAVVLRSTAAVGILLQIFQHTWDHALDLLPQQLEPAPAEDGPPVREGPEQEFTVRQLEVLKLMAGGVTDLGISRKLGLSVRTVRRTISELMERCGAQSRFQVGFSAARLGWIDDHLAH